MELDYSAIGRRIQAARKARNMTQEVLCNMTDLSPTHISQIENGRTKLSLPALVLIANALETTVDSLLFDNIKTLYTSYDQDFHNLVADCTPDERETILLFAIQVKATLKRKK